MADLATTVDSPQAGGSLLDKKMKKSSAWVSGVVVGIALLGGLGYIGFHIQQDLSNVVVVSVWPYLLLGVALLIALGFEFVNGFHDTANAVATVIYTHCSIRISRWCGRGCATCAACWFQAAQWPSASSRCCRWN